MTTKLSTTKLSLLRRGVLALALALGATVGLAPGAQALCAGSGCNGLDPSDSGCSVSVYTATLLSQHRDAVDGTVQLRWGTLCNSAWARFVGDGPVCVPTAIQVQNGAKTATGSIAVKQSYTKKSYTGSCNYYTAMVNGDNRYGRVRSGYINSWPGGSSISWGPWTVWYKIS